MNVINIEHVTKVYGEKRVLDDVSCGIQQGDKIGIVGINGTGKTTILKMLAGLEEPDDGQVVLQNGVKTAYLAQTPEYGQNEVLLTYVTKERQDLDWSAESEAKTILNQLGFSDYTVLMGQLSGGQRRKAALARTLMADFDILLMDEPTNHLDYEMLDWLEEYLNRLKCVVIMVTHDRYFLDQVSNRILEISQGQLYSYEGRYSTFLERKAQREEMESASERKRSSILRMELEWAGRGCRARSTKQKARLERLEQLKQTGSSSDGAAMMLESSVTRMGKKTVELINVCKEYGTRTLIRDFSYLIPRNQRLGIVGPNGCGKSTLLKMMGAILPPDEGCVEVGETIRIGYFAQEVPDMETDERVIDYIKDVAEYLPTKDGTISAAQMLERFLFTADMQYAPVNQLSGGERKRLHLLKVLFSAPNVLLFDEISNDMDIPTLTLLEDYLGTFSGIVVLVSHDRYCLDNVADRILEMDGHGSITQYEGGYTDYVEKKCRRQSEPHSAATVENRSKGEGKSWKKDQPVKLKFSFKEEREYEVIDAQIESLEQEIEKRDFAMLENATNSAKLSELFKEKETLEKELEMKTDRWIYLNELAEKIEQQKK